MGTIHLAVAGGLADFRKLLVVKELRQELSANHRFVEMFLDEAKLAARLNHPNVVQTVEAGQQGERYFLAMEFLDGQPYSAIWQRAEQSPLVALPVRLKILCDALTGLHYAHTLTEYDGTSLHIVHRDVSPQNIFVTYDGQVKVVDFGIANATVSSASSTIPGLFKGKFGYASPEQVRGERVDARTDVFAMGVVLWETLTMKRFSDGVVSRSAVSARLAGKEPRAAQYVPQIDAQLAAICDRALATDPDDRYASADEMRHALEDYLLHTGLRVEGKTIGHVVASKFAVERSNVHRLIDRHIKHGAVERPPVSAVGLGQEEGNNEPTQVADLEKFVRNTTEQTIVSGVTIKLAHEPPWRSPRKLGLSALGALVAVGISLGVLQLTSLRQPSTAEAATHTVSIPLAPLPTAAAAEAGAPAAPHLATPGPTAPAPTRNAAAIPVQEARRPSSARFSVRRPARGAVAPVVHEPLTPEPSAPPPIEAPPPHVDSDAASDSPKATMGTELKRVEKSYPRRAIDTQW
jgi:eukaryotic-like serine/threonine-protein kinase